MVSRHTVGWKDDGSLDIAWWIRNDRDVQAALREVLEHTHIKEHYGENFASSTEGAEWERGNG